MCSLSRRSWLMMRRFTKRESHSRRWHIAVSRLIYMTSVSRLVTRRSSPSRQLGCSKISRYKIAWTLSSTITWKKSTIVRASCRGKPFASSCKGISSMDSTRLFRRSIKVRLRLRTWSVLSTVTWPKQRSSRKRWKWGSERLWPRSRLRTHYSVIRT